MRVCVFAYICVFVAAREGGGAAAGWPTGAGGGCAECKGQSRPSVHHNVLHSLYRQCLCCAFKTIHITALPLGPTFSIILLNHLDLIVN